MTNIPNTRIRTFSDRWSFIWQCFFPASILKHYENKVEKGRDKK